MRGEPRRAGLVLTPAETADLFAAAAELRRIANEGADAEETTETRRRLPWRRPRGPM